MAFLEYGDPAIYGSWSYWLKRHIKREIRVIPGVSAFNAANAMLATNVASRGSVIITAPRGIMENRELLEAVAKNGDTMAIFVGLREAENLSRLLMKYYPEDMPVTVAYKAGYSGDASLMKTTLKGMTKSIREREEQFLGLIYIGRNLD
ncbi:MAG: hypothetical protein JXA20_20430 [Spirochaetes bacterium]|nr:hypothetical protein [Spirochaetota bacterium]